MPGPTWTFQAVITCGGSSGTTGWIKGLPAPAKTNAVRFASAPLATQGSPTSFAAEAVETASKLMQATSAPADRSLRIRLTLPSQQSVKRLAETRDRRVERLLAARRAGAEQRALDRRDDQAGEGRGVLARRRLRRAARRRSARSQLWKAAVAAAARPGPRAGPGRRRRPGSRAARGGRRRGGGRSRRTCVEGLAQTALLQRALDRGRGSSSPPVRPPRRASCALPPGSGGRSSRAAPCRARRRRAAPSRRSPSRRAAAGRR